MNISKWVRSNIATLEAYSCARTESDFEENVLLDANENPFGKWNRYPDPYQIELKKKWGKIRNVAVDKICVGNGSDEMMDLLFRCFCTPNEDNVMIPSPSYGMYEVLAQINQIEARYVLMGIDFSLDIEALFSAVDNHTKLVFLCSPNNPTGNTISIESIEKLARKFNGILVVDEAYIDFSMKESAVTLIDKCPNIVVLQTLSKAWGLAALRVGFCIASKEIIDVLNKVKPPYNVNGVSQKLAIEALDEYSTYKEQCDMLIAERNRLIHRLSTLDAKITVFPSEANFLLIRIPECDEVYKYLLKEGVTVRNRSRLPGCKNCLRISIGTPQENNKLYKLFIRYYKTLKNE